jgi:hypothetical protein
MKQTAVEWLIEQLKEYKHLSYDEQSWIFEQAKEMEKEQMVYSIYKYIEDNLDTSTHGNIENVKEWSEQYYNETFKSE